MNTSPQASRPRAHSPRTKKEEGELLIDPVEVCLVMRHFHPILAGAAERFRRYSVDLAKGGIRFRVFTLRESESHLGNERLHEALEVCRIDASGAPWERDAALFQAAWQYLATRPPGRFVLQTSLCHKLARPWLVRIRQLGCPCLFVGTMVGRKQENLPLWRQWLYAFREWRNYRPFDRVVASTTVMRDWLRSLGVRGERIVVIPNGVDINRFRPASKEEKSRLRDQLGLPDDCPIVLFAGNIVPRKGVDLLLGAWPGVVSKESACLAIVGGFDRPTFMTKERIEELRSFQDGIRQAASSPQIATTVLLAGESDRIEDWMRAADLFVFPTEQEGMGNVVLEAMGCGLPCVITRFHGLPEVEFGSAGLEYRLVERTVEDLKMGLIEILSDDLGAESFRKRARNWAISQAGVERTIDRYSALYRELTTL